MKNSQRMQAMARRLSLESDLHCVAMKKDTDELIASAHLGAAYALGAMSKILSQTADEMRAEEDAEAGKVTP